MFSPNFGKFTKYWENFTGNIFLPDNPYPQLPFQCRTSFPQ